MKTCWECGEKLQVIKGEPYHYTESGLDNVYLHGIIQYKCAKCMEGGPEIPNIQELHLLIGSLVICKRLPLTAQEIKYLRKELGQKSKDMAELLAVTPQEYSKWENARDIISRNYDKSLRMLYILNAESKVGKVLHKGIRFTMGMASIKQPMKKPEDIKIDITASEWIRPFEEPIFSEECVRA